MTEEIRFSIRQAETVARHLRDQHGGKISATMCRWKTPEAVAKMYLGGRAGDRQIKALAKELLEAVGIVQEGEA